MAANIPTTTNHEQIGIQSPQALADWNPSRWSIATTTNHEQIGIQSPQALADWNPSRWSG